MSEQNNNGSGGSLQIPAEAFNTPELRRQLAQALAKDGSTAPEFRDGVRAALREQIKAKHPPVWEAIKADAELAWASRGEPRKVENDLEALRSAVELGLTTDAFLGLALYRIRMRLFARNVPVLPKLLHRVCMACFQMCIGETVFMEPGVYIPHGQVVIDGAVEIGRGTVLTPWITIGLRDMSFEAPKIGRHVMIGTGASVLGPITIGNGAKIGSRAVVIKDVAPNTTVVGAPAAPVAKKNAPRDKGRANAMLVGKKKRV